MLRSLTEIKQFQTKDELNALVASLKQEGNAGVEAGLKLQRDAKEFGVTPKEYLILSANKIAKADKESDLNGYEMVLSELNIPFRNDFERGVLLQAASETFATYPGTRALFPQVIDDMIRWANRQDMVETVAPLLANSRTISGAELLSTVVDDDSTKRDSFLVSEGARIPVRTIKTSEKTVKIFKHGSGIRTTYEFSRRASIEILIPYANRIARELEISKVKAATSILINGDGAYGAAPVVNQSSFDATAGVTATAGQLNYKSVLAWLVSRAKLGLAIDTIAMNWDGYYQWLLMFAAQGANAGNTAAESISRAGISLGSTPAGVKSGLSIVPAISSGVAAGTLIGFIKGETLEELVEAGSQIQENEISASTQTTTVYRTENSGFRLVYGDTRSIYNFAA